MKFWYLAILLVSMPTFARQYFQCSSMDAYPLVMVVNLTTVKEGTLFISSGMENPETERRLFNISYSKTKAPYRIYNLNEEGLSGEILIPSQVIDKSSDNVTLELKSNVYSGNFSCFSRIYND